MRGEVVGETCGDEGLELLGESDPCAVIGIANKGIDANGSLTPMVLSTLMSVA